MKIYYFFFRSDKQKEAISKTLSTSRLQAAKYFANKKQLSLKKFLELFEISK